MVQQFGSTTISVHPELNSKNLHLVLDLVDMVKEKGTMDYLLLRTTEDGR